MSTPAATAPDPAALECIDLAEAFNADLLDQVYRKIYKPAFPLPDEQEDPDIWAPRLNDPHANPQLCCLVLGIRLTDPARRDPRGLLIAEYYAASQCVLISYLAVDAAARGQGLARRLFEAMRQRLRDGRLSQGRPVKAVLAEIHDPSHAAARADGFDPLARLRVMARFGGQRIPIDYLQPPLGPARQAAVGLWLIAFPDCTAPARTPTAADVRAFLVEFYRELGSLDPERDPVYTRTFASLDTLAVRPTLLQPLFVRSTLCLRQAAVAIQYAVESSIDPKARDCAADVEYCEYFHSYEKDLLSHAFRNPPPVRSSCVPNTVRPLGGIAQPADYCLQAALWFPTRLRFRTEGETLERTRDGVASLPVTLSFSRSDFLQSGRSILNLVVHLDARDSEALFGEYELLCLSKQWCAADESEVWLRDAADEDIRLIIAGESLLLKDVAARYLGVDPATPPVGGCLQIVFRERAGRVDPCALDRHGQAISARELIDALNLIQQETADPPAERLHPALNAAGCLLQNILDLENVDLNELEDMLDGISTSRSAVTAIHRNTLFALTVDDRLFDDLARSIGMSPYLLLPQAALLHNERILFEASGLLRHLDEVKAALQDTHECDAVRGRLIKAARRKALDDLPGGPDWLIRRVISRLWKWHRAHRPDASGRRWRIVNDFVAELDRAIEEGLAAHARRRLSELLDRDSLGNLFQYVSERWIFEEGHRDRGLDSLAGVLRKRAAALDTVLAAAETRHSEWRNTDYTVIGLAFTLYTVIPLEGFIRRFPVLTDGDDINWPGLLLQVGLGLAMVSALLGRRVVALVYRRALSHVARKLGPDALRKSAPATPAAPARH